MPRSLPPIALRSLLELESDLSAQINQVAIPYNHGVHVKHRLMGYHDFFVQRLHPGERVLDIGCGTGAVAYDMAARAGAVVMGIDLEAEHIATARRLFSHPNLRFVQGNVLTALPDIPFDTLVISNILEHIEQRVTFLKTVQAQLQPHRWLVRVPMYDRDWLVPLRQELGLFHFSDRTHFTEYTQASFAAEMQAAELTITHLQINWGEIWAEVQRQ
ncbi:hypothetical protein DO97_14680 [Neosynechococcus sphagnicola sy1]|uniref:Methyltransferase domain-containing protein n=1 Tax=Neosynechococcus sphagnicola sy1 TaxID=1497020 RepID=A0A098TM12_9CYAN|nr:class I SAM-dependent methyltransferase [Neosynechococcus sphagnicola]KGF71878.1 hypothetical protein DO97_14680 [Neosynechococcus sphagnicola sy1]